MRNLTPAELAYVRSEQHAAPFRIDPTSIEFEWKYYPEFSVEKVVESLQQGPSPWHVEEWLQSELKHGGEYRLEHYQNVLEQGVLDPIVILQDDVGYDIAEGWHRVAYCYLHGMTLPAYVGYHPGDLSA